MGLAGRGLRRRRFPGRTGWVQSPDTGDRESLSAK